MIVHLTFVMAFFTVFVGNGQKKAGRCNQKIAVCPPCYQCASSQFLPHPASATRGTRSL